MSVKVADAVYVTVTGNPGTGTVTLGTRVTGFFPASSLTDGTQYYYVLFDCDANGTPNGAREIGYGTFTAAGTTFSRDSVETSCDSSGTVSTSKINFASGTQRLFISPTAGFLNSLASLVVTPFDPSQISWAARFESDNITPQTDNTTLTSWPDMSGNGNNATNTGTPKYRTAASGQGINGLAIVTFDGSSARMTTTTGGASLTGNFYFAAVALMGDVTGFYNFLSAGQATNGERRSLCKDVSSGLGYLRWVGQSADLAGSFPPYMLNNQPCLVEVQWDGTNITMWLNGTQVAHAPPSGSLVSFASTALYLASNPSGGELFKGGLAAAYFNGATIASNTLASFRLWIANKYQFFVNGISGLPIPEYNQSGVAQAAPVSDVASLLVSNSGLVIGGETIGYTGGGPSAAPYLNQATLSVNGILYATCTGSTQEHALVSNGGSINVFAIWNKSGYSAMRCLRNGGLEGGAFGVDSGGGSAVTIGHDAHGSTFIEASNFENTAQAGCFTFVQTGAIAGGTNGQYLRHEWRADGNAYWYGLSVGSTSPPVILNLTPNGQLNGQAGIATNATTGFWRLPTCAGTPTGVATDGDMVYDSTNHKPYIYLNGVWTEFKLA